MATWGGYEVPGAINALAGLRGQQRQPELPDEWNFPGPFENAEPDYTPKPGQKGYDPSQQMASARRPEPANQMMYSPDVGYWLAGMPVSMPPHAYAAYLNWLARVKPTNALAPQGGK